MGQIANQMAIELLYKLKQKIKGKKAAREEQEKKDREQPEKKDR